jgi:hypothetical protein
MKFIYMSRRILSLLLIPVVISTTFSACSKFDPFNDKPNKPNSPASFNSDVLEKWMTLQIRLMKNSTGIPNHGLARHYAYSGVAACEALAPGMPAVGLLRHKWNGLSGVPSPGVKKYYWPANVNAALASINRSMFPNANEADKAAIDSLENALFQTFAGKAEQNTIQQSVEFGQKVATAVFNWSETDGYKNANRPYSVPVGPGKWKPTSATALTPVTPYWGENRTVIKGSTMNTKAPAPVQYSGEINSEFYNNAKFVHTVSLNLHDDQKAMAFFWRDVPGVSSPGHWLNILHQTLQVSETNLAKAAVAYALTGAAINDGLITCFASKYEYNLVRPVTYIREEMGLTQWNTLIGTPAHPEYPSAHSTLSAAAAEIFLVMFPQVKNFTDHTYDYLGYAPRTYSTFRAVGEEAGLSRLFAGIHFYPSIEAGLRQGKKVAHNIINESKGVQFDQ